MQEKSSHKAMESPRAPEAQEAGDVYLFTGNGLRPAMAVRAKSLEDAEHIYHTAVHTDDHE